MSRFSDLYKGTPTPAPKVEAVAPKPAPKKVVKVEEPKILEEESGEE